MIAWLTRPLAGSTPCSRSGCGSRARPRPGGSRSRSWPLARSGVDPASVGREILAELDAARAAACVPLAFDQVERILRDAWGGAPERRARRARPRPGRSSPPSPGPPRRPRRRAGGDQGAASGAGRLGAPGSGAAREPQLHRWPRRSRPWMRGAMLREVRERVLEELDLENQGQAQRRFHRALRDHPLFTVPAPVTQLSHETRARQRMGRRASRWRDAEDRDAAAARSGAVRARRRCGREPSMPISTPEDVLVLDDGRLAIVDFGATRTGRADRARSRPLPRCEAFVAGDVDGAGTDAGGAGVAARPEHAEPRARAGPACARLICRRPDAVRLDTEAVRAAGDRAARAAPARCSS